MRSGGQATVIKGSRVGAGPAGEPARATSAARSRGLLLPLRAPDPRTAGRDHDAAQPVQVGWALLPQAVRLARSSKVTVSAGALSGVALAA